MTEKISIVEVKPIDQKSSNEPDPMQGDTPEELLAVTAEMIWAVFNKHLDAEQRKEFTSEEVDQAVRQWDLFLSFHEAGLVDSLETVGEQVDNCKVMQTYWHFADKRIDALVREHNQKEKERSEFEKGEKEGTTKEAARQLWRSILMTLSLRK